MIHEETLAKKFVQKWFWMYLFTFLIGPLGYITKMVISRDLSVEEVWMLYWVISFVTLLGAFNDLWCTESLNYFLPKYIIKKEYGKAKYLLSLTFFIQIVSSLFLWGLVFFGADWLSIHYFNSPNIKDIIQISTLFFIGINLLHFSTVLMSVSQNIKIQKLTEFFRMSFVVIWTIFLFLTDTGNLLSYAWIWIWWVGIAIVFAWIYAYRYYYIEYFRDVAIERDLSERTAFFHYSWATLLTANVGMILSQVDMQLIIYILGSESTGYYSNYLSIIGLPFMVFLPIMGFLFPVVSELNGRWDTGKIKIIHERFYLYFWLIAIWTGGFFICFWDTLSTLLFWKAFETSGHLLQYSSIFLIFNFLVQINFSILAGIGNVKERGKILLITLPINIILNIVLISWIWIYGSALAVWLSWIPLWYMSHRAVSQYSTRIPYWSWIKNIIITWVTQIGIFYIIHDITKIVHPWWVIFIAVCANICIFCLFNFGIMKEFLWTIRKNF